MQKSEVVTKEKALLETKQEVTNENFQDKLLVLPSPPKLKMKSHNNSVVAIQ